MRYVGKALVCLSALLLSGLLLINCEWLGISTGGSDRHDDMLVRCRDCDDLLNWLQATAMIEMERRVAGDTYDRDGDDDDFWDDDDLWDDDLVDDDDVCDDDYWADDDAWYDDDVVSDDDAYGGDDDDDHTDTNVQEEGVDEADIVKTDGKTLFIVTGGYLLLYDAGDPLRTKELGRFKIEGSAADMYLADGTALVFSSLKAGNLPPQVWSGTERSALDKNISKITMIDCRRRDDLFVIRELYAEGKLISSRRVGSAVRVVLSTKKVKLDVNYQVEYWRYDQAGDYQTALAWLLDDNRAKIRGTTLREWLPNYYSAVYSGGKAEITSGYLSHCENHYRSKNPLGNELLTVLTFWLDDPTAPLSDISIIGDGRIVYASQTNLYIVDDYDTHRLWAWWNETGEFSSCPIDRFDIGDPDGPAVYVGSAEVAGWLLNQFSMSEYEGYLRMMVWKANLDREQSAVYTFQLTEDGLKAAGKLGGLGESEDIYAVRMIGPRGYLVTFRQIDPLFTIDLSDPRQPRLVGELEVPGYSSYLHPLDDGHLLAVGQGGDEWGLNGTQVLSLFDVTNFAHPKLLHQYNFGLIHTAGELDHHAFLYDPTRRLVALPYRGIEWEEAAVDDDYFAGVVVLHVTPEDGFSAMAEIDHSAMRPEGSRDEDDYWEYRVEPRRTVRIGEYLYTISNCGLIVTDVQTWKNVAEIGLPVD